MTPTPAPESLSDSGSFYTLGDPRRRVKGTERRLALARLMLVASGFLLFPLVEGHPGTHPTLAWGILFASVPYGVFAVLYQPAPRVRPAALSYLTSTLDAAFVMAWLWVTGGFDSPFYLAIYLGTVSNAVRYSTAGTLFAAGVYATGYVGLYALGDFPLQDRLPDLAVRLAYMGMAAVSGIVVAQEIKEETAARLDSETTARSERMQLRLARAERLASLGTLAGGVAHEINNPLAYVTANLQLLREQLGDAATGEVAELIDDAEVGAQRIRRIVSDLKSFSRERPPSMESTNLGKVIRSALNMSSHQTKHRARVVEELDAVPRVQGDETRLAQVLLNLLINAAQAIPEGQADRHEIRVRTRQHRGRVVVQVQDTGPGISPEVLPRIFDPFFTTKDPGVGTGLGLSICHRIVSDLGGQIEVKSEPARGTTVSVWLLVSGDTAEAVDEYSQPVARPRRRRVLIIDDEPALGRSLARALRDHHDVETLDSAQAALDRLAAGQRWDVLVCDLMMPVVTGMDFLHALEDHHPELVSRCVFMTGGAYTAQASRFLGGIDNRCLEKPFTTQDMLRAIDEATAGATAA